MATRNILLCLFLFVVLSGLYGQERYTPGSNAYLGSITWPDMPITFKGEEAGAFGWKGDTIPSFDSLTMNYVLILPRAYQQGIPALTFSTRHPNSTVAVTRAKSLEGSVVERTITFTVTAEDSTTTNRYSVLLKKEQDTLDIQLKSSVSSKFYKVSDGYSLKETIKGVTTGTTVSGFYERLTKAHELQTIKVKSGITGAELAEADAIRIGDTLVVLSASNTHTTKYILEVTAEGLSVITLLNSAVFNISVTGSTGTISGFNRSLFLKTVLREVAIPAGATLTMVDQNDAYKTLVLLNFDTVYVNVLATSAVYFEVTAENGESSVLYQLIPTSHASNAYVTSDLYVIDQDGEVLYPVAQGTSVSSLLRQVTPAPGATMKVVDKEGFVRTSGVIYKDDKLVVTSEDGSTSKTYYFPKPWYGGGPYLAFLVSDEYIVNQVRRYIVVPSEGMDIAEFKSNLYPAFGSIIKVIDLNGKESALATLVKGDKVLVTSADGIQSATYRIDFLTGVDPVDVASTISIFPNPGTGRVIVQGLAMGNRFRVLTTAGVTLRDVIVKNSTEIISLDTQPAGLYLFVVSDGNQFLGIQKVVKK